MKGKKMLSNAHIHDRIGTRITPRLSRKDVALIKLKNKVRALVDFSSLTYLQKVLDDQSTLGKDKNINEMPKMRR